MEESGYRGPEYGKRHHDSRGLGYLDIPENTLIDIGDDEELSDEQMVLVTHRKSGASPCGPLWMAANMHRKVQVETRAIP